MARQEETREDLLAEATALVERVEIALTGDAANEAAPRVVLGFRRDGSASVYFGEDPAYHFNSRLELRRAYLAGRLLKADRGALVSLTRRRTECEVQLLSHELAAPEAIQILAELARRLSFLGKELAAGRFRVMGQVPGDADVLGRVRRLLAGLGGEPRIAQSPRAT